MSNFSFRENHLFRILDTFEFERGPLDLFLRNYFRANKAAGSKDRRFISETIYGMIRWKGLIDYLCGEKPTWQARFEKYQNLAPEKYADNENIPLHVRVSFPQSFFKVLSDALGEEKAFKFCLTCNETAPTTLRVNSLKTDRETLFSKWQALYPISRTEHSASGIVFHKKINFFDMDEFKEGCFEIQDEGSQMIADLVAATPKDRVLDFCAGSGGKTLAFAHKLQNKGQIYLHDIRDNALLEAKKRLKRAGIQNAQILHYDDISKKNILKGTCHWVLVDAPCSGTGTLRRNPDMKWKFDPQIIENLVKDQREIFEEALTFLHPHGKIVYATCSILPQENEEQLQFFMEKFKLKLLHEPFFTEPVSKGMDGFFGAVLIKC
jgi:16S rRNA (cytosine967-C5)-methyltransferase